jgi:hypothetical protein
MHSVQVGSSLSQQSSYFIEGCCEVTLLKDRTSIDPHGFWQPLKAIEAEKPHSAHQDRPFVGGQPCTDLDMYSENA